MFRALICLSALLIVAGCGNSSSPTQPQSPSTPTAATVTVTNATYTALANATAGIGSDVQIDEDFETGSFMNETIFSASAGAGAAGGNGISFASAGGAAEVTGSATWAAPDQLESVIFSADGGGEATTGGEFTVAYAAAGGGSGTLSIDFTVPTAGIDLFVDLEGDLEVRVRAVSGADFDETLRDEETSTLSLAAGTYRLGSGNGAGGTASAPPSADAGSFSGSLRVEFRNP